LRPSTRQVRIIASLPNEGVCGGLADGHVASDVRAGRSTAAVDERVEAVRDADQERARDEDGRGAGIRDAATETVEIKSAQLGDTILLGAARGIRRRRRSVSAVAADTERVMIIQISPSSVRSSWWRWSPW
jgi:hypothetical protein